MSEEEKQVLQSQADPSCRECGGRGWIEQTLPPGAVPIRDEAGHAALTETSPCPCTQSKRSIYPPSIEDHDTSALAAEELGRTSIRRSKSSVAK